MSFLSPILESAASVDIASQYESIKKLLGCDQVPEPFLIYANVPSFLQDFSRNFKKFVWCERALDAKTHSMIAFVTARHAKNKFWEQFFKTRCLSLGCQEQELAEIAAVHATNATYNTFFKFRANAGTDAFDTMGVGLRANVFTDVSLDKQTLELINIVIGNLNACQPCTAAHVEKGTKTGLTNEQILEAVQCAATIYSGCVFAGCF